MYKHKRNTDSRLIKWLRHEGFTPVINPFFKNYLKNMFMKKTYKNHWLFMSTEFTLFRRFYDGIGWTFVMCFTDEALHPPALYVFTSKAHTPSFHDSAFGHAAPVSHHYLAGAKSYVRGQAEKLPYFNTRPMRFTDWWNARKEII